MKSKKHILVTVFLMSLIALSMTPVATADYTEGNEELLNAIDAALKLIIDSGDYDTIYGHWFDGAVVLTDDSTADTATTFPVEADLTENGTLAAIIANKKIVFGSDTTYPPFEYIEGTDVVGFDADIADAIAAELSTAYGVTIVAEMSTNDWDPIIPDLKTGKFDAILSAMTKTEIRAQEIDFTRSYYTSKQAILARNDSATITGIDDLNAAGVIIGLQSGTTSDLYAAENLPLAEVKGYTGFDEAILALQNGDIQYLLGDLPVLAFYAVDSSEYGFEVVGTFGEDELFGIGIRMDDTGGLLPFPTFAFLIPFLAIPVLRKFRN
jgi:polar amino acid transport system substrate-binding protein